MKFEEFLNLVLKKLPELSFPLFVLCGTLILGFILKKILFLRLERLSQKTKTGIDDAVIAALKGPFIIWCLMLGIYFALKVSVLSDDFVRMAGKALLILGISSVTIALANITTSSLRGISARAGDSLASASLIQNVARIIIYGVGALIILNSLGISITPIMATLGVGGLAVALALQETLSNLFGGFHIIAAKQIKIGDYVKLSTGEEGYVVDINWRTTKIRMLPNNVILIPNSKLIQTIVTNYYLPTKDMAVLVNVGVHYSSDLKKVEKVTCEVGKEVMEQVQGGVPEFTPFIRYHTFNDFSIDFTVILRAKEFVDQYLVKHEFVKRLHERYNKEGINIPYPIRAINYEQEKAG